MTIGDFYVLAALACVVVLIIRGMLRDKKQGKTCGGCSGCSGCACSGNCSGCCGKQKISE